MKIVKPNQTSVATNRSIGNATQVCMGACEISVFRYWTWIRLPGRVCLLTLFEFFCKISHCESYPEKVSHTATTIEC